eukprot:TRINITY_DN3302_c0_g1_i1.p1 TRINITY_DN3302_c0_g1~~TRINITY_DN3302_c0_g1_i1.p1  ORF type:complete len:706 (+),score=218.44 TRINITY_DN3302_c0_g1_i1:36-2153(+)
MARRVGIAFLGASASLGGASVLGEGSESDGHPIGKVITMLHGLMDNVKQEAASEEVTYSKFTHWCGNSKKTLEKAISSEKAAIESLESEVEAKTTQSAVLGKQIKKLEGQIGELDASDVSAKAQRDKAAGLYDSASKDYDATIKAIDDAITALSDSKPAAFAVVKRAVALVESSATEAQRDSLRAFVAQRPDLKAAGDEDAHVKDYAFKSGGVIEMLKQLKTKFEDEKLATDKAETNSINAYSLAKDARSNAHDAASASKTAKSEEKGSVEGELIDAKAALEETQNDLDADSKLLGDTEKQCALKASEWAERSSVRKGELEAMQAGIDILAKVAGVRTEAPANPILPASPLDAAPSFLQVSGPTERAVQLLRAAARESHSHALDRFAQQIAAHGPGPFNEVNNMIQKMIHRLMSEQTDEDNHKNWCDQELSKSNSTKVNKEDKIAELTTKIDLGTATVAELTGEIGTNADMLASIESHMAEATEIRETGKRENAASIKDAEAAQTALANAIAVLEQYYKETGMMKKESWEFLQQSGVDLPEEPSTWAASYTGVADPAEQPGGIVTVLKKVAADFDKMEADTRAQEETDDAQYKEDMKECKIEKSRRERESEMKSQEKKRLLDKVASMTKTKKAASTDLEAVEQYLRDLEPACVNGDSTYEDRKAARAKEIDALHEAQGILAGAFSEKSEKEPAAPGAFLATVRRA